MNSYKLAYQNVESDSNPKTYQSQLELKAGDVIQPGDAHFFAIKDKRKLPSGEAELVLWDIQRPCAAKAH